MGFGRFRASALAIGLAGLLSVFAALPGQAATTTVTVTPADLEPGQLPAAAASNKWFFYNDQHNGSDGVEGLNNALGTFVVGPTGPGLLGVGSAQVGVSGDKRRNLATYQFRGTPLASITTLKFSTYNPSAGNGGGPNRSGYLHFNVDYGPGVCTSPLCASPSGYQRRLVFVPANNGTVIPNQWQEWDAVNGTVPGSLSGQWSFSGPNWPAGAVPGCAGAATASGPRKTWSQILACYPAVRIHPVDSFVGIRVGEPYPDGYTENIDAFKFGTGSDVTTFDFEPYAVATDKDDCKNGGWQNVRRANGSTFKNQGDCVSYISTGR